MPNGTYSTESRYFLVFGIKPNNCLTNVSKAIRYTDLLQWKMLPKSLHMLSLEAERTYLTLFENCRIVDPPTGRRSQADPYESNDFRWTIKARPKKGINKKRSKEFLDVQTNKVAASDLSYSEESLRALFLAALAHDLLTPLLYLTSALGTTYFIGFSASSTELFPFGSCFHPLTLKTLMSSLLCLKCSFLA